MKNNFKSILLFIAMAFGFAFVQLPEISEIAIGTEMPMGEVAFKNVSGKYHTLNKEYKKNGLVVIFSCNTCPYVKLYEERLIQSYKQAKNAEVGFVLVNSNESLRKDEDSHKAMKKHANAMGYEFSYLADSLCKLADAFGAMKTPHVFVFDKGKKLVYKGAIDNNPKDAASASEHYLKDALLELSGGPKMKTNSTRSVGCSIKRMGS